MIWVLRVIAVCQDFSYLKGARDKITMMAIAMMCLVRSRLDRLAQCVVRRRVNLSEGDEQPLL